jgi:putative hydrolase of the HAD superfamily
VLTGCRALLFDFGGTLDADGLPWKERVSGLYREEGITITPQRFDALFYAADDALVGAVSPALSFRETIVRLVAGINRGLELHDDALVVRIAARFAERASSTLRRNAPLLSALGRRYRLGIVSNFYGNLATVCAECEVSELVGVVIDSEDIGCRKPDPRIFHVAAAALGVEPADTVVVGDSLPRDMAGARAAGMRHVWLAGCTTLSAQPCCPSDPVISSLEDLAKLLP